MAAFTFKHGDRPLEGYAIQRGVGRGGFGEVYFAVSDGGKEVALKYLRENPAVELRGVSHCLNLKNSHLVTLYDVRKNDAGEYFVVMEYISGPSLRDLMITEPDGLGVEKAAYLVREIGKGLSFLHDRNIVHRDLKPGNIFCEDGQIKIGDYGLAKHISVSRHSVQTASVGTVHYMAPEIGSGQYSRGVDIYALGVILYEMLLGRVPFEGSTMGEVLMKHLTAQPDVDALPSPFPDVIRTALAKDPRDRFATIQDLISSLYSEQLERSVNSLDPASLTVRAAAAARRVNAQGDLPSPAYAPAGGLVGRGSSAVSIETAESATVASPSRPDSAGRAMATFGLAGVGLLLVLAAPLSLIAAGLDGNGIRAPLIVGCSAALLVGVVCFATSRWMSVSPRDRKPRLALPFRRTLMAARRDDLPELITRYFLSLGYELKSQNRLLWNFEWSDESEQWGAGDATVHLTVAAFEMEEHYRVNCHMELSGDDACWATQNDLRNMARDLDGFEELVTELQKGSRVAPIRFSGSNRIGGEEEVGACVEGA